MKVKITRSSYTFWYKKGEIYEVEPYRHNPEEYWEVKGWDGGNNMGLNYWIMKIHTTIFDEYNLPEELFEI